VADWKPIAWVYVFLRGDGIRKLGATVDMRRRRTECAAMACVAHKIEAFWQTDELTAIQVEHSVHYTLHHHKVRGHSSIELYRLPLGMLAAAVRAAFAKYDKVPAVSRLGLVTDEQVLALQHLPKAVAARQLGMTPAGYGKRLAKALENQAKEKSEK
jgi:hypothetical protein